MKRIIGFILTVVVLATTFAPFRAFASVEGDTRALYGEDKMEHAKLAYGEIKFEGYDENVMYGLIDEILEKSKNAGNAERVNELYDEIVLQFDVFATQFALNSIRYYSDVQNEEYADLYLEMSALYSEVADQAIQAVRDVLADSACKDSLAAYINDQELVDSFLEYEDMTEREFELSVIRDNLTQQYDVSSGTDYSVFIDGTEWTEYSASVALNDGTISQDEYYTITLGIAQARNAVEADIYLQLVNSYNESARLNGFKNYAEYAYSEIYNRDYTTEEIKQLYAYVKKYFVPLQEVLYERFYTCYNPAIFDGYAMEDEALVDKIEPFVGKVDPRLTEAYDYLKTYHTYEMDIDANKMNMGYTTTLYQYGMPFIFNAADGSYYDVETLIHEFGHYNQAYHNDFHMLLDTTNMDVAEIHSQGLEVLFFKYADDIYGAECATAVQMATLYNLVNSVISGCTYDEFQNEVFAYEGTLTVSEINRIYRRVAESYGNVYGNDGDEAYGWTNVSHTFHSPMYYISYATSALSALDILAMAEEDRNEAVSLYMELTAYGLDTSYCELMEKVGMNDIFEESTVSNIATHVDKFSEKIASDYSSKVIRNLIIVLVVIVLIIIILIIIIVKLIKRAKRKKKEKLEEKAAESAEATEATDTIETTENDDSTDIVN